jgi:uncharacterized protein (UPF0276 family)
MNSECKPFLGFGLGLRPVHYDTIITEKPKVDWFEIITENYLIPGGKPLNALETIRADYPIVMHGVSLSIGSYDPLDWDYLRAVKDLVDRVQPAWISDHVCWTGIHGINTHDLLPLIHTQDTISHVVERVQQIQDFFKRRILLENISSYITYAHSDCSEWDFLKTISEQADSLILLDVNNIYVNSINHDFDPITYITHLPSSRIFQVHLAGHQNLGSYIIDTHDREIIDPVWELYRIALKHHGRISTMIERDDHIPPLNNLIQELEHARTIAEQTFASLSSVSEAA